MSELLPVNAGALSADARVLPSVRAIGARHGFDYTDDAATAAMLAERRRALRACERGPLVWLGALALSAGVVWPILGPVVPAFSGKPVLAFGPAGPLLVVAVAALALVRRRWKRELLDARLAGYREVLGLARAHGVPVTHVPGWLVGRSFSGGRETMPIPVYAEVEPSPGGPSSGGLSPEGPSSGGSLPSEAEPSTAPDVPTKPASVMSYEAMADEGGWHDETGCLLLFAGIVGVAWAVSSDNPLGYLAAFVAVPVAISIWVAGSRQGRERQRLRETAVAYVRALSAAQAAGAGVPELSPVLQKLLEEETEKEKNQAA
ncbi:hypothetical protein [Streptomyces sporangiiformans]|uniref:hypothetical protein n=1 Tax=Streptomyces sporangiiformans TaxID=2315329 RepID=UPI001F08E96F|nr:hypothetical protein [Streptomyces sporangiiformans]